MRISINIKSICLPWMHSMGSCLAGIPNFDQEGTVQHLKTAVVPPAPVVLSSRQYIRNAEEEGWAAFLKQLHRNAASLRCNCQAPQPRSTSLAGVVPAMSSFSRGGKRERQQPTWHHTTCFTTRRRLKGVVREVPLNCATSRGRKTLIGGDGTRQRNPLNE